MDLDPSIYQDPERAQQALKLFSPFMLIFWTLAILVGCVLIWGVWRLMQVSKQTAAPPPVKVKPGEAGSFTGLSRDEMKLLLEAEIKRRKEAGEDVTIRNVFEGPLDWEDVDETGAPRPKAERGMSYEEWKRSQGGQSGAPP